MRKPSLTRTNIQRSLLSVASLFAMGTIASAAPIIIDDFEGSEGHFYSDNPATASGSNRNVTAATADLSTSFSLTGTSSEFVTVTPTNPGNVTADKFPTDQFRLRFLSGGGTVSNNVNIGPDGYVGYFIRTTSPGLTTAPGLDDGADLELGVFQPVIADGEWHLYQFNLDDEAQWDAFAGTAPNGIIDGPNVSFDSIFFIGSNSAPVEFYLDTVAYNPTGDLSSLVPVPEPGSVLLLSFGALGLAMRRRR